MNDDFENHLRSALRPVDPGGAFTDLSGRTGPHGGSVVATNGLLQEAVLNRLNGG